MALSQAALQAATQAIEQHQRLLIVPHANVDPDGISSALACGEMFRSLGKDVTVLCPDPLPEVLRFLPGFDHLQQEIAESQNFVITLHLDEGVEVDKLRYAVEDKKVNIIVVPKKGKINASQVAFQPGERPYDLIVAVDTADLALFGHIYAEHVDLFSEVPILNIDHHISNTQYGQIQLIDPTASSATEVLYSWFLQHPEWKTRITPDMATLLLTGLITDTRSFQNPNTTPRSLEIASELLERGARQQEIIQQIYKTKPLSTLKIWGRALNRIQMDPQARIVWSSVSKEDLQEMASSSKETHGILDELISTIPDADVYVLFTELEDGGLKASMRSSAAIDVSRLAGETFGGGGHPRASGFRVRQFENFSLQVLECIRTLKDGIRRQQKDGGDVVESTQARAVNFLQDTAMPSRPDRIQQPAGPQTDVVRDIAGGKDASQPGQVDVVGDLTMDQ